MGVSWHVIACMKRIFSVTVLGVLFSLMAVSGSARAESTCLEGDALMGPNCVHVEARPGRDPMSTVYRVKGKKVSTVWDGVGTIVKSTKDYLIVEEPVDNPNGGVSLARVRHDWTGSEYAR